MSSCESSWPNKLWEDATPTLDQTKDAKRLPMIQKVPFTLRKGPELEKYYVPIMFSFGPIHYGKHSFAENLKRKLARDFVRQNHINEADLWCDIMGKLSYLKHCYDQELLSNFITDEDLASVFFVDGCAVLHFIYCFVNDQSCLNRLDIKKDQVAFARRDLFLLENQLPYGLLESLIDLLGEKKQDYRKAIADFVQMNLMVLSKESSVPGNTKQKSSPGADITVTIDSSCHLLDLLHKQLIVNMKDEKQMINNLSARFSHQLVSWKRGIMKLFERNPRGDGGGLTDSFSGWISYRSVNELKTSGIRLKPSKGISLRDITFQGRFGLGILRLPRLVVDDSTAPKLFNLIAYEMCPDFINDFVVISYVCFLDSIIDEPGDVRELRKANIVLNALGSDEDVARLFNEISRDLADNHAIYQNVKKGIEDHYNSMLTTWIAQFVHDHFDTPWTMLAFLGVLMGLAMSFIQTYYTIHPVS